jgi:topoisomerase-4 subunit A
VLAKGQGVTLQRYRDGGLADATTLKLDEGLSWKMGGDTGRTRTESCARRGGTMPPVESGARRASWPIG